MQGGDARRLSRRRPLFRRLRLSGAARKRQNRKPSRNQDARKAQPKGKEA